MICFTFPFARTNLPYDANQQHGPHHHKDRTCSVILQLALISRTYSGRGVGREEGERERREERGGRREGEGRG